MGASSVTGTGTGSAERQLRGRDLDSMHHIINRYSNDASVIAPPKDDVGRIRVKNPDGLLVPPPEVVRINARTGTVYLRNPSGLQIEIYRYTRKEAGPHVKAMAPFTVYSDHQGKRYKPWRLLKFGETEWTLPNQADWPAGYINFTNTTKRGIRKYFKFGVRALDGTRSHYLSNLTIASPNFQEFGYGIFMLIFGQP